MYTCICVCYVQLCRKDGLAKNIKRTKRQLEKEGKLEEAAKFDFTPITFILPGDYALFVEVRWLSRFWRARLHCDSKLTVPCVYGARHCSNSSCHVQEFRKPQHAGAVWIMKPIARSQGKGIFLFNKLAQIQQWKSEYRWKPDNAAVRVLLHTCACRLLQGRQPCTLRACTLRALCRLSRTWCKSIFLTPT